MFNYFAGIASGSDTRLDLVAIMNDYNNNSLKDITLENYGREIERQGNCGDNDVEDMRMDGYNLITTKLILNWQRELPTSGTYRFKYNAFIRTGEQVKLQTFYSESFDLTVE